MQTISLLMMGVDHGFTVKCTFFRTTSCFSQANLLRVATFNAACGHYPVAGGGVESTQLTTTVVEALDPSSRTVRYLP